MGEHKASLVRAALRGVCERCCPGPRVYVHETGCKQNAIAVIGSSDLQVLDLISSGVGLRAGARGDGVIQHGRCPVTGVAVERFPRTPQSHPCYGGWLTSAAAWANLSACAPLREAWDLQLSGTLELGRDNASSRAEAIEIRSGAAQSV